MSIHTNIYEVLKTIKIPKSISRPNVSGISHADKYKNYGNPCESCTFGLVNNFFKKTTSNSKITEKYPSQYEKIVEYGKQICNHDFTSICVNHNLKCYKHKDRNNVGDSTIVAVGDFYGGGLYVDGELHDIHDKPLCFNGSKHEHWTEDFDGDRYSLVFFDNTKHSSNREKQIEVIQNDIHEQIKLFGDDTFDMIYTNPPYGTTENKWDKPLDWNMLFPEMWRVLKPNGVIVLHCSMPFTYELIRCEKPKYHYTWIKNNSTNFFKAKTQPLRKQEEILVYYKKQPTYNPQMVGDKVYKTSTAGKSKYFGSRGEEKQNDDSHVGKYPTNVLNYDIHVRGFSTRPNDMVDFFIKTYTNEKDKILDLTCYNALTGMRCKELNRKYVGVDLNKHEDWDSI